MYNFKQLKVWQKGFAIAVQAFKLTETFPKEQKFGLTQQITKASVSIPSNIAEGSSRSSVKGYSRFALPRVSRREPERTRGSSAPTQSH